MKKTLRLALCLILVCAMLAPSLCFAEENYDTLADWDLKVKVPEGTTAVLKGSTYYIYAQHAGYIPYVMITAMPYESEEKFIEDFTASMQKNYADFTVTNEPYQVSCGDKLCWETDYGYTVSGYAVTDRRIVVKVGELVYMFASKEIGELGMTLGDMLDDVVADCEFLSAAGSELPGLEEKNELSDAYLYREKDGMPKYWLDLSGAMADTLVLHCYFRSGEPTFYETVYYLDLESAEFSEGRIDVVKVTDDHGFDVSDRFKALSVLFAGDRVVLSVRRDEKTLAGGADDNILTGTYRMEPAGAGCDYRYRQDDGMLKYWLDLTGGDIRLHAMFRSGDPEFYEEVFTLDSSSAEPFGEYGLAFEKVYNEAGLDVSDWFESLTLTDADGAILMDVKRDEKTLAGGADDNILTGTYLFEPYSYLLPADSGPYTAEQLAQWAQIYYFRHNGFFPPKADTEKNADGSYTVHLYEIVKLDGVPHTATSAWYTVDAYGTGSDDITGRAIELCR